MLRDRILYQVNEDEVDSFLDFMKQRGFDYSSKDSRTWFSQEPEGDHRVGYIEHDPEPFSYRHTLNIPAGGSLERVVEEYRRLQMKTGGFDIRAALLKVVQEYREQQVVSSSASPAGQNQQAARPPSQE